MKKTEKLTTEEGSPETSAAFRQWCASHGLSTNDALPENKAQIHLRENGDVVLVSPMKWTAPTIRDTALALRAQGKKGIPLHEDHEALEGRHTDAVDAVLADHALLALELLEAIHRGDPAPLRAIADAMKAKPETRRWLTRAYCSAVRKAGGIPDDETIQAELVALGRADPNGTPNPGACGKLDTLHRMLEGKGLEFTKAPRRVGRPRKG
jgi:hypothetical protein